MSIAWLPAAKKDPRGRELSWSETSDPKGCLHTTETSSWPGYQAWTVHPHATVMPIPGTGVEVRQNIPFTRASFSLRNLPGGAQTNTDFVFQFELIGTSEKGGPGYYWPGADDLVLLDLYRKVIKPLSDSYGIPIWAHKFQAYPASYGARGKTNTVRLSGAAFDKYSGWLGHQHVPENVHGDPGAFPWDRMIELAKKYTVAREDDDMSFLSSRHKYTKADAAALGNPRLEGTEASWNAILRFPPAAERLRREMKLQNAAVLAALGAVLRAVKSDTDLSAAQLQAIVEEATRAALEEAFPDDNTEPDDDETVTPAP